jgi:hypothetical protein
MSKVAHQQVTQGLTRSGPTSISDVPQVVPSSVQLASLLGNRTTRRALTGGGGRSRRQTDVRSSLAGSTGRPLDGASRALMEARFGRDFADVRVHADGRAAESARTLGANAFTAGRHIGFGQDRFRPTTTEGRRLLAHELAHVVQQGRRTDSGGPVAPAEGEADRVASGAVAGQAVSVGSSAPAAIQLQESGEDAQTKRYRELKDRLSKSDGYPGRDAEQAEFNAMGGPTRSYIEDEKAYRGNQYAQRVPDGWMIKGVGFVPAKEGGTTHTEAKVRTDQERLEKAATTGDDPDLSIYHEWRNIWDERFKKAEAREKAIREGLEKSMGEKAFNDAYIRFQGARDNSADEAYLDLLGPDYRKAVAEKAWAERMAQSPSDVRGYVWGWRLNHPGKVPTQEDFERFVHLAEEDVKGREAIGLALSFRGPGGLGGRPAAKPISEPVGRGSPRLTGRVVPERLTEGPVEPVAKAPPKVTAKAPLEPVGKAPPRVIAKGPVEPVRTGPPEPVGKAPPEVTTKGPVEPVGKSASRAAAKGSPEPVGKPPRQVTAKGSAEPIGKPASKAAAKGTGKPAAKATAKAPPEPTAKAAPTTTAKTRSEPSSEGAKPASKAAAKPASKTGGSKKAPPKPRATPRGSTDYTEEQLRGKKSTDWAKERRRHTKAADRQASKAASAATGQPKKVTGKGVEYHHHADVKEASRVKLNPDVAGEPERMSAVKSRRSKTNYGQVGDKPGKGKKLTPHNVAKSIDKAEQQRTAKALRERSGKAPAKDPKLPKGAEGRAGLVDASGTSKWRLPATADEAQRAAQKWNRTEPVGPPVDKSGRVVKPKTKPSPSPKTPSPGKSGPRKGRRRPPKE